MSLKQDAEAARVWLSSMGYQCVKTSIDHNRAESKLLDRVNLIAAVLELDDEAVLRIRCASPSPFVFRC